MKKAEALHEIMNAFDLSPLKGEDYDNFFCDTTVARVNDEFSNPVLNLAYRHKQQDRYLHSLLIGHRGSGKSTELQRLKKELGDSFLVIDIFCAEKADLYNITYIDILILIMNELILAVKSRGYDIKDSILENIWNFWNTERIKEKFNNIEFQGGVEVEASSSASIKMKIPMIKVLFELLGKVSASLKTEVSTKEMVRETVEPRISSFLKIIIDVVNEIKTKHGITPFIIIEDLDRIEDKSAVEIFKSYGNILAQLPLHVVYSFPINVTYREDFNAITSYFPVRERLPMIKIRHKVNGVFEEYNTGLCTINEIVEKRAGSALFDDDALKLMIRKTGGYLRDLFNAIQRAAMRADRRNSSKIQLSDAEAALNSIKYDLSARIDKNDYKYLNEIYNGDNEKINKEKLLPLLKSGVVLEYNGTRWHALHPLAEDYLLELGEISK